MDRKSFQAKCRKITKQIIDKNFPELKEKRILVFVPPFFRKAYSGLAVDILFFPRMIFINKKRYNEKNSYLRGLIAHELGHQSLYLERSFLKGFILSLKYWTNPKFRRKEEDAVNKLIIRKGFAKDIYETTKKIEKRKSSLGIQKYYMTSEEIKAYAKKIGKL